jgi:hypothetical protein
MSEYAKNIQTIEDMWKKRIELRDGGGRMTEKKLRCSRYIENFNPPYLIEKLVHKVCESVADAFLCQIEYGKDYVINTELVKDDWADGFGTKYTYNLKFDELVRCGDCVYRGWSDAGGHFCARGIGLTVKPNDFCAWAKRRES